MCYNDVIGLRSARVVRLDRMFTPNLLSDAGLLFCCCVKGTRVHRASGWSPFSGLSGHTVRSALSFHPALLLRSPFCSVACLWLPQSMELPSYILKGLLRNPPVCVFFSIQPIPSSPLFTFECQSLLSSSFFLSLRLSVFFS